MWAAAAMVAATLVSSYVASNNANKNAKAASSAQAQANQTNIEQSEASRAWQGEQNRTAINENIASEYRAMDFQAQQQQEQARLNAEAMRQAQAYDTEMSNTAYRRAMVDMKAAGLNPILAYQQGGASSPTVSPTTVGMGSGSALPAPSGGGAQARVESTFSPRVSSAAQTAGALQGVLQAATNIKQTEQQTLNLEQQQRLLVAQEENTRVNTAKQAAEAITEGARPEYVRAATRTEQGRPALIGAQTAQAASTARNVEAQTETERERPSEVRERTREYGSSANRQQEEFLQRRRYGPPGAVSSTVGGISQTVDEIGRSIRDYFR